VFDKEQIALIAEATGKVRDPQALINLARQQTRLYFVLRNNILIR